MDLHFHKVLQWHEPKVVLLFLLVFRENPMDRLILNVLHYRRKKICIELITRSKDFS